MILNNAGWLVDRAMKKTQDNARGIAIDPYIIMPDHLHAVITLGINTDAVPDHSISDVVRDFKTIVQRSWLAGIKRGDWPPYENHLWQSSFYDNIIGSDRHFETTREYILANPARWLTKRQDSM